MQYHATPHNTTSITHTANSACSRPPLWHHTVTYRVPSVRERERARGGGGGGGGGGALTVKISQMRTVQSSDPEARYLLSDVQAISLIPCKGEHSVSISTRQVFATARPGKSVDSRRKHTLPCAVIDERGSRKPVARQSGTGNTHTNAKGYPARDPSSIYV